MSSADSTSSTCRSASSRGTMAFSGPNIMSSYTVGMNIWLSEFCSTHPSACRTWGKLVLSTVTPSTVMRPWPCTNPSSSFISVDLPAPLAPISPTASPSCMRNDTFRTAGRPFS